MWKEKGSFLHRPNLSDFQQLRPAWELTSCHYFYCKSRLSLHPLASQKPQLTLVVKDG